MSFIQGEKEKILRAISQKSAWASKVQAPFAFAECLFQYDFAARFTLGTNTSYELVCESPNDRPMLLTEVFFGMWGVASPVYPAVDFVNQVMGRVFASLTNTNGFIAGHSVDSEPLMSPGPFVQNGFMEPYKTEIYIDGSAPFLVRFSIPAPTADVNYSVVVSGFQYTKVK